MTVLKVPSRSLGAVFTPSYGRPQTTFSICGKLQRDALPPTHAKISHPPW